MYMRCLFPYIPGYSVTEYEKRKKKKKHIYKAKESLEAHNMHFTHPLLINTTHFFFFHFMYLRWKVTAAYNLIKENVQIEKAQPCTQSSIKYGKTVR